MDPTTEEEALCRCPPKSKETTNHGLVMQASLQQHSQISELHFVGNIDFNTLKSAMESMSVVSSDLDMVAQQCLVKSVLKTIKQKGDNKPVEKSIVNK